MAANHRRHVCGERHSKFIFGSTLDAAGPAWRDYGSMRDLFAYRLAFRCTTDGSSYVLLGQGWAAQNYTAATIDPLARGVGWRLSRPACRRIKTAYLTDADITDLATYAAALRGHRGAA